MEGAGERSAYRRFMPVAYRSAVHVFLHGCNALPEPRRLHDNVRGEPELGGHLRLEARHLLELLESPIGLVRLDHDLSTVAQTQTGYRTDARLVEQALLWRRPELPMTELLQRVRDPPCVIGPIDGELYVRSFPRGQMRRERCEKRLVRGWLRGDHVNTRLQHTLGAHRGALMRNWIGATVMTVLLAVCRVHAATAAQTVAFSSGGKTLHGLLYKPAGKGPFPAVLYNHGGSPGLLSNVAFDAIAPHFVAQGWLFFAPYRRGQGLSAGAGPFVEAEVAAIEKKAGQAAADAAAVRLETGEQLDDQLSALAWLEAQPFVQANRIAVMGNSVGGIQTVLGAERHAYCAAVDLTGAAMSWRGDPALRKALIRAVEGSQTPILFIQAENDYTTAPSKVLYAAARTAHRDARIHIYPPFHGGGSGGMQGHSIAWLGVSEWWPEAFGFLETHCRPGLAHRTH